MSLHWKMHTHFPFTRVFVLGLILFFLGIASMIISIIAFITESWGHYVATGMWGGASILASGSTAIFASRLRSLASVKTLLFCCVITTFTSLTMLILSAGGLSLNSGFYARVDPSEYNKRTSNLIHASLLVISVFCLSGNVLAMIVCCKYLFFERFDKSKHRRRLRHLPEGTIRVSTSLRGGAPSTSSVRNSNVRPHQLLLSESQGRRHSDNNGVNRVQIEYRRAHRRSASDQPYPHQGSSHSQSRRLRNNHQEWALLNGSAGTQQNSGSRHRQGRHMPVRALQHEKPLKSESDPERQGLVRGKHSTRAISNQATLQIRMAPNHRTSHPHQIRLPTEFDEEELPPYEPSDSVQPQNGLGYSDSGDESDSENSSSTDAHSYDAVELCVEGAEAVPMVNLRHQRIYRHRRIERTTHLTSPPEVVTTEVDESRQRNDVRRSSTLDSFDMHLNSNQQTPAHGNSNQILSQNNPQTEQLGEYECLLSVSPEVCAITGDSSAVHPTESDKIPHLVHENLYENGPCYENIQAVGLGNGESHLNALSKSCERSTDKGIISSTSDAGHKITSSTVSARIVPVKMVNPPSLVTNDTSPVSLRKTFGSPNSAFRPVKPPSQAMSPQNFIHLSSPRSGQESSNNDFGILPPNMCISPSDNTPTPAPLTERNLQFSPNDDMNMYVNQGAIPKCAKKSSKASQNEQKEDKGSLSWKNIPLPLSYNHSDSLSNDEEKKMPSKRIPFAESNENSKKKRVDSTNHEINEQKMPSPISLKVHKSCALSSSVSAQSHLSSISSSVARQLPSSEPQNIPTEMISSAPALSFSTENILPIKTKERTLITTQPLSPPTQTSSTLSSLSLASLQESSFLRSRPSQQRMGGNQSMLQCRRDEMRNLHLNQRNQKWQRPTSLLEDHVNNADNHALMSDSPTDKDNSWSPADRMHPLSLTSYLKGQPSSQHHQNRQSLNLHQHHVPQPQQPRLGVQLQRRPHHMLVNNNDQVHEHHQQLQPQPPAPQPQPQPHQVPAGAQEPNEQEPRRANRPLFSVLL